MPLNPQEQQRLNQLSQKFSQGASQVGLSSAEVARLDQLKKKFEAPQIQNTPGQAALQGFGQAATLGYLPQLQALAEKGVDWVAGDNTDEQLRAQGFDIQEPTYTQQRDEFIDVQNRLQESNPNAMIAGNVIGGITAGLAGGAIGGVTKAATGAQRLASAAKTGAAFGAIRNPGETEGEIDPVQFTDRLKNASIDAVTGMVTQGGFEVIGKVANAVKNAPGTLKDFSQAKSLKAAGAMLKDFRKAYGRNKVSELGQTMIDNGVLAVGDDIADIAKKSEIMKGAAGQRVGQVYQQADDIISKINGKKLSPNILKELDDTELDMGRFAAEFRAYLTSKLQGKVGARQVLSRFEGELDDFAQNGIVSMERLQELRRSIDDQIDFAKQAKDLPGVEQSFLEMRNKLNDVAKNRIKLLDRINGTKLLPSLEKANKEFSNLAEISKIAKDKLAREESNAAFGLRERISTGVGATVGGMIGGIPGAAVGATLGGITTKAARQYGTPFVAIATNRVARALEANPKLLGSFADPLLKAATSPKELTIMVNSMMKDPEFKKKIDKINLNDFKGGNK